MSDADPIHLHEKNDTKEQLQFSNIMNCMYV